MALRPIDRWADEPAGFNRPVADAVYATVMKMDADEAVMFTRVIADAILEDDLMVHGEMIAKAATDQLEARVELLKGRLARTVIAKSRKGEDVGAELVALEQITKSWVTDLFSHSARSERAKHQRRGVGTGRYVRTTHDIDTSSDKKSGPSVADALKIPPPDPEWGLDDAQLAHYQDAYHQVAALIEPYKRMPSNSAFVHLIDEHGQTKIRTIPAGKGVMPAADFDPRAGKLKQVKISTLPPPDEKGAFASLFTTIGMPVTGAVAAGAVTGGILDADRLDQHKRSLDQRQADDEFVPSNRVFRRVGHSAKLIDDTLGNAAPPPAKMALKLAQHVGNLGPSAQKVIGPTVDRASYRYRGTERKPDPRLTNAMEEDGRSASRIATIGAQGVRDSRAADDRHQTRLGQNKINHDDREAAALRDWDRAGSAYQAGLIDRGTYRQANKRAEAEIGEARSRRAKADREAGEEHKSASADAAKKIALGQDQHAAITASIVARGEDTENGRWKPGATLGYFSTLVPTPELNELHLKAGTIPPSQGVILNDKGKVMSQAVGYGDDHYLPFTLKGMRAMRGGSYIRTRTWGGPTSEDIRTSLIGGARRLTVVSNNGTFTINFDPSFKGGRRHNDKAHRMVGRYEHLLDAVRKGEVSRAGIDPGRMEVLETQAKQRFNPEYNPTGYDKELQRLKIEERKNPVLSPEKRNEAATEYVRDLAASHGTKGDEQTPEEFTREIAQRTAAKRLAEGRASLATWNKDNPDRQLSITSPSLEVATQEDLDKLRDDDPFIAASNVAEAMGDSAGFARHMDAAAKANRDSMRTMRLDGPGYLAAMNALQEQFPYYISNTEFHPKANSPQREDTGYVRPGSNRGAAAQLGLYDSDSSAGKVRADSIRGQGSGVVSTAVKVAATAAAAATAGTAVPSDDALRQRADLAMLNTLLDQTKFGPNATFKNPDGKTYPLANVDIRDNAAGAEFPEQLKPFFGGGVDRDALLDAFETDPAAMRTPLLRAVSWMESNKAFPVGDQAHAAVLADFKNGGKVAAPASEATTLGMVNRPDREYQFAQQAGREFDPAGGATSEEIAVAYLRNDDIKSLGTRLATSVDDADFTDKAAEVAKQLRDQDTRLASWNARGGVGTPPVDQALHERQVRGLVLANTLNRRFTEAERNEAAHVETPVPMAAGGGDQVHNEMGIHFPMSPQQLAEMADDPELAAKARKGLENMVPGLDLAGLARADARETEDIARAKRSIDQ